MAKIIGFASIFLIYFSTFLLQEQQIKFIQPQLTQTLPAKVHKIAAGYMYQLWAEMLYIKTTVFLGGLKNPGQVDQESALGLAEHFQVISDLHPDFIDTYFMCESSLSSLGPEYARETNAVLEKGMRAKPDNWILPFFKGFNHFRYLDEPREAGAILYSASQLPGAPVWLGHLAGILSAEGGDIRAGLIWLKAMLVTEKDEAIKERYHKEIIIFQKAVRVLKAIEDYTNLFNHPPRILEDLVPQYISHLPKIEGGFILVWNPPTLKLIRPSKKTD